jgi:hypothetical protein
MSAVTAREAARVPSAVRIQPPPRHPRQRAPEYATRGTKRGMRRRVQCRAAQPHRPPRGRTPQHHRSLLAPPKRLLWPRPSPPHHRYCHPPHSLSTLAVGLSRRGIHTQATSARARRRIAEGRRRRHCQITRGGSSTPPPRQWHQRRRRHHRRRHRRRHWHMHRRRRRRRRR